MKNNLSKIVTIRVSDIKPVMLPYTIYVNTPMSVVKDYSLDNPLVYVIVFYTLNYVGTDDWDEALDKKWATRVMSPVWVANTEEMDLYVNHFITLDGMTKDDWEVV